MTVAATEFPDVKACPDAAVPPTGLPQQVAPRTAVQCLELTGLRGELPALRVGRLAARVEWAWAQARQALLQWVYLPARERVPWEQSSVPKELQ